MKLRIEAPVTGTPLREGVEILAEVLPLPAGWPCDPRHYKMNRRIKLTIQKGKCEAFPEIGQSINLTDVIPMTSIGTKAESALLIRSIVAVRVTTSKDEKNANIALMVGDKQLDYQLRPEAGAFPASTFFQTQGWHEKS